MAFRFRNAAVVSVLSLGLLSAPNALAQPTKSGNEPRPTTTLTWSPQYHQSSWVDYALLGVTGGIALAGLFIPPDRSDPWQSTLGMDESVRNTLRLHDSSDRRYARTTSDVLAAVVIGLPTAGDALLNAGLLKTSPKVAWEMSVINLEVLGITAAMVGTAKWAFSRERPFGRLCGTELNADSTGCTEDDRYVSYFSGHTAFTFGASTAMCVHHHRFNLWGNVSPWVPCATGYALAATTGALRMAADRHYVSDVLTGAVVGTAVGVVVPWLHYSGHVSEASPHVSVSANGAGLTLTVLH